MKDINPFISDEQRFKISKFEPETFTVIELPTQTDKLKCSEFVDLIGNKTNYVEQKYGNRDIIMDGYSYRLHSVLNCAYLIGACEVEYKMSLRRLN